MKLYRCRERFVAEHADQFYEIPASSFDDIIACEGLFDHLSHMISQASRTKAPTPQDALPPIDSQELWAAGVTYYRSREARMEESKSAGGGDFYDRVYSAARPELFFKATGRRVIGPAGKVRIRSDARWSVPEPELTLALSSSGRIIGYTIGNDMSSRDIEGENPLYLPQAKVYDGACALGPVITLADSFPPPDRVGIRLLIARGGSVVFDGMTG